MFSIGVLISGGGTDLQSIIDSIENGYLNCSIKTVISDREGAFGLERAKAHGIETHVIDRKLYKESISREIEKILGDVDLVVLAGFLSVCRNCLEQLLTPMIKRRRAIMDSTTTARFV